MQDKNPEPIIQNREEDLSSFKKRFLTTADTKLRQLKNEIDNYREKERLLEFKTRMYKKCGITLDDNGQISNEKEPGGLATLAQNKTKIKNTADELYQLQETDTDNSTPSEENDQRENIALVDATYRREYTQSHIHSSEIAWHRSRRTHRKRIWRAAAAAVWTHDLAQELVAVSIALLTWTS
ncbi:hypothetical protein EVAR_90313_1 [Eumeta japonica]|uniref:Uncharacterized protein n=1 Tax=Eumeta variegata TaxID=151549 RepID=A0A4C1ZRF1_EUMVA|nr:hypothetical protein EVAR_90313_1 [Eumeta japonica]